MKNTGNIFSDKTPDQVFAWRLEGYKAQRSGLGLDACRYPEDSTAWRIWRESWLDTAADHAFFEGAEYARTGGLDASANPYDDEREEHHEWEEGFYEGLSILGVKVKGKLYLAVSN